MILKLYQVDAFANQVFRGNPAAVCPLDNWLPDDVMQQIAAENNLAETAFYVIQKDNIEIRWFTPKIEVDLCGHATLAAAYVLKNYEGFNQNRIPFYSSRSGNLPVQIVEHQITLNFPADEMTEIELTNQLIKTTSEQSTRAFKGKTDYMLIFKNQQEIEQIQPNLSLISKLEARGLIVTAKGNDCDFVSRFFAPQSGVAEDPVTGSAHTSLTPYWAKKLNKTDLKASQLSERGGELHCKFLGDRVEIGGKAHLYLKGEIFV